MSGQYSFESYRQARVFAENFNADLLGRVGRWKQLLIRRNGGGLGGFHRFQVCDDRFRITVRHMKPGHRWWQRLSCFPDAGG